MGRVARRWWPNALSLFLLSLAFALLFNKWRNSESNRCSMTFMFRRIYYLDIGLKHEAYSLLLYAEGLHRAQRYGESGELDGFPLIFVPGNAGSGRQVRSLGSLLQNKTERLGTLFHFDTFALDFNGEMTALNFDYIESQAQFLAVSIGHILSLYSPHNLPKIVLIGHSMGGIVIQKMLADNFGLRKHIAFVVTFATPFSQPPVLFERRFLHFWDSMNGDNKNGENGNAALPPPAIVSVSGGLLDEFIDEGWTLSPAVSVHAHSAAVDRIWAEADHLCIVWCNEIVRQTSRFLFDFAASPSHFLENFPHFAHLHYHSLGLSLSPIASESVTLADVNVSLCAPKCPLNSGYQKIEANPARNRRLLLLAIANLTEQGNSIPKFDILTVPKCGQNPPSVGGTRFLDAAHLFVLVNLSNCDGSERILVAPNTHLWVEICSNSVADDSAVFLPEMHLSFADFFWSGNLRNPMPFSMEMNPLAIVPIHFPRNEKEFGIFRVEIWRKNCRENDSMGGVVHRRIVFSVDGVQRRFDQFGGSDLNSSSSMLIYPTTRGQTPAKTDTHYQLLIIDTAQCAQCSVRFSVDLRFSLIRLFRRAQHFVPASCVFASFFVHFYFSITAGGRRFVSLFVLPVLLLAAVAFCGTADVLLLLFVFDCFALLFCHLLLFTVLPVVSAVFRPFCAFSSSLPLSVLFFVLFALSTTFTNNSFPLAVFGFCLNIFTLHRRFVSTGNAIAFSSASLLLALPVFIFQFPHTFTCAWNFVKYGQIWSPSDPFFGPNLALSLFSIFSLFHFPALFLSDVFPLPFFKFRALSLFSFYVVVFLIFSAFISPMSFLPLDDLSLFAVFAFAIASLL